LLKDFNLQAAADHIKEHGWTKLPVFLPSNVSGFIDKGFKLSFEKREILDGATEYTLVDKIFLLKLSVIFNNREFLSLMSRLLGKPVKYTKQRVYWNNSECQELGWHDDNSAKELRVGVIRFEWSDSPYKGGDVHFRDDFKNKEVVLDPIEKGESYFMDIQLGRYFHRLDKVRAGQRKSLIIFLVGESP
jgi:hypothetical protein